MMKCEEYRELFSDLLDGDLPKDRAEDFRDHLRGCKSCQEELGKFRQAQMLLKLIPRKKAPPGLWEVIKKEIKPAEQRPVFFIQSFYTIEGFRRKKKPSSPPRIYGISFGMTERD